MSEQPVLVDSTFLDFFCTAHPRAGEALQNEAKNYVELLACGWTLQDLILAAKTGYGYARHAYQRSSLFDYKSGMGPQKLFRWLEHYYQQSKAIDINMSLDDFVKQWCAFWNTGDKDYSSLDKMLCFVKARRRGMPHADAEELAKYYTRHAYWFVELRRRGLDQKLVQRIQGVYRNSPAKYIVEAHRRGATDDELCKSIDRGEVIELAHELRQAARAADPARG